MTFDLVELGADFLRRNHLIVDMTCLGAFRREEFIVIVEVFDYNSISTGVDVRFD